MVIQAGKAPIVNGVEEQRMRVGCGSAAVGIFAPVRGRGRRGGGGRRPHHRRADRARGPAAASTCRPRASRCWAASRRRGAPPSRDPGNGWGGTDIADPLSIIEGLGGGRGQARPAPALMTSTTGEHAQWYVLDDALQPVEQPMPTQVKRIVDQHRRELRAFAVHRAVPRRCRRQPARGRHREPRCCSRAPSARAGQRHLRRRAGLCVAGRRILADSRCHALARQQLRHRAPARDRRAHRVQHAARRLRGARRPHGACLPLEQALARGRQREDGAPLAANGSSSTKPTRPPGPRACWVERCLSAAGGCSCSFPLTGRLG